MNATQAQLLCDASSLTAAGAGGRASAAPQPGGGPSFSETLQQVCARSSEQPGLQAAPLQPVRAEEPASEPVRAEQPQPPIAEHPQEAAPPGQEPPVQDKPVVEDRQPEDGKPGDRQGTESAEGGEQVRRQPRGERTESSAARVSQHAEASAAADVHDSEASARDDVEQSEAPARDDGEAAAGRRAVRPALVKAAIPEPRGSATEAARPEPAGREGVDRPADLVDAVARDSDAPAQQALEVEGKASARVAAQGENRDEAPAGERDHAPAPPSVQPAPDAAVTRAAALQDGDAQTAGQRHTGDTPARETALNERGAAPEADAPAGRPKTAQAAAPKGPDAKSETAEVHVAQPVAADGAASAGESTSAGGGTIPGARARAVTGMQAPPEQAAIAAWRQYATQAADATTGVPKGTVQQALRTAHQEVVQQARMAGGNGRSEVTVRLDPPELGRMKVEIEMHAGKVDVRIRVEDPHVREAIRTELQNLDRTLRNVHLDPTRLEVSDYPTGRQDQWGGAAQGRSDGAPEGALYGTTESEGSASADGWTVFSEAGGIDCLV